jgi:hypothetical protein
MGALPVQNPDEVEDGGLTAWCHSAWIMYHRAWRAALDPAAYDQLMRQLGMPNTPSETEHQINEQLGSSDTLEGNPPQIRTPHRDTLLEVVSSASYEVKDIRIPHQDTACSVTQEPHLFNQIPILMPI